MESRWANAGGKIQLIKTEIAYVRDLQLMPKCVPRMSFSVRELTMPIISWFFIEHADVMDLLLANTLRLLALEPIGWLTGTRKLPEARQKDWQRTASTYFQYGHIHGNPFH